MILKKHCLKNRKGPSPDNSHYTVTLNFGRKTLSPYLKIDTIETNVPTKQITIIPNSGTKYKKVNIFFKKGQHEIAQITTKK